MVEVVNSGRARGGEGPCKQAICVGEVGDCEEGRRFKMGGTSPSRFVQPLRLNPCASPMSNWSAMC